MNDNEIIKALENSIPVAIEQGEEVVAQILKDTLNLINRQKAEIEKLTKELEAIRVVKDDYKKWYSELIEQFEHAKSEAIKEFADRLKNDYSDILHGALGVEVREINTLVKEMTEDEE